MRAGYQLTVGNGNGNGRLHHFGPIAEEVAKYVPAEHGAARPRTRATESTATASASSAQRAMIAGRLATAPFHSRRAVG